MAFRMRQSLCVVVLLPVFYYGCSASETDNVPPDLTGVFDTESAPAAANTATNTNVEATGGAPSDPGSDPVEPAATGGKAGGPGPKPPHDSTGGTPPVPDTTATPTTAGGNATYVSCVVGLNC